MNRRKLFESENCKQSGITLIALVISIIVMLILAGVSLNATIGDNGIITQAQNAKLKSGMSVLEEYLQEKFVEYYDDTENYTNKVELLNDKIPELLLTNSSTRKYIIYNGKAYYLLNKKCLPSDIQNALVGGDSSDAADYTKLYDVYGITQDLKVYYVDNKNNTSVGNVESSEIDPNMPLAMLNNGSNRTLSEAIKDALSEIGIEVDDDLGITVGNVSSLKTLTLDGSKNEITSLKALGELTNIQELTLKNLKLSNLEGIENLSLLNYVYFYNCDIDDYSALSTTYKLNKLYFHFLNTMSEDVTNKQINLLGNALKNAFNISNLQYLGIFGVNLSSSLVYPNWTYYDGSSHFNTYTSGTRSNLTDISGLSNFNDNLKQSINYLYLNNNNIASIESLSGFYKIKQLMLSCNNNLKNLNGLENHIELEYLSAHACNLENIEGLQGTNKIYVLSLQENRNLTSLNGIEQNKEMISLNAKSCNLNDISKISNLTNLQYLYMEYNYNLQNVKDIANCTKIIRLYLTGNNNMLASDVAKLENIINQCGNNYSIPKKYYSLFENITSYDYSSYGLKDDSEELNLLKNRKTVTRLNLSGNINLSNNKINEILSTMTGLKYLSLKGIGNLTSIEWIKNVPNLIELDLRGTSVSSDTDIKLLNDYGINLINLIIDNPNIKIEEIEDTLININNNFTTNNLNSWINNGYEYLRGAICLSNSYDFSKLTRLTKWYECQLNVNGSYYFDFSNCKNMTYFFCYSDNKVKLPKSITSIHIGNGAPDIDLSNCENITYIYTENTDGKKVENSVITLPENNKLETLYTYIAGISFENLNFLGKFNANNLKNLTMIGYEQESNGLNNIEGLKYAPNIESFDIHYTNVSSLNGIQYLSKLKKLSAYSQFVKISDISYLEGLSELTEVNLSDNKISKICNLSNLSKLNYLNLSNNSISDLSNLQTCIINNTTSLKRLDLRNNNIEEYTASGTNNVEILNKLKSAGTSEIKIDGNNFSGNVGF